MTKCAMPGCDNDVEMGKRGKWKMHCSHLCRGRHNSIVGTEKRKQTCLERFGETTNLKTTETKDKIKNTLMETYGVEHQMHIRAVKDKIVATNIKKYGVSNPSQSDDIKRKKVATCVENYGVDHPLRSSIVQDNRKLKSITKHGVDHYSKTSEYREKYTNTCIERYGADNPSKVEIFKTKSIATWEENYGRKIHPNQRHISDDTLAKLSDITWLNDNKEVSTIRLAETLGVTYHTVLYAYTKHNIKRATHSSIHEHKLAEFILKNYDKEIILNTRDIISPLELDIYLPDINVAIEFNGIYWHSDLNGKDKTYHMNKTTKCYELGIKLIHIFENEWSLKNDLVKARILSIISPTIYSAPPKYIISTMDIASTREFLVNNSIDEPKLFDICYCASHIHSILALLTFKKLNNNVWELTHHINVDGIAEIENVIFNQFIDDWRPSTVIAHHKNTWGVDNIYPELGFSLLRTNKPTYKYTKNYLTLENKSKYQRNNLEKILQTFDFTLSTWENMQANGYDRIWDCGSNTYIWKSTD